MLSETVQEVSVPKTGFLSLRLLDPEVALRFLETWETTQRRSVTFQKTLRLRIL